MVLPINKTRLPTAQLKDGTAHIWSRIASRGIQVVIAALCIVASSNDIQAQPVPFGSADDPSERIHIRLWSSENILNVLGGFSLVGPTWRAATSVSTGVSTQNFTARLESTVRFGFEGIYKPDFDELYDALRQIDFVRFKLQTQNDLYVRVGPISRMRLGSGHLVNFFNSTAAWDERTIGSEFMWRNRALSFSAFTDNVIPDGVVGGRLAIYPLLWSDDDRARTLQLGVNYVADIAESGFGDPTLAGYNIDISFAAAFVGEAMLRPFATFAVLDGAGGGLGFGADFMSDNFVDVARFNVRMAMYYNSSDFRPGYFGAFYQVDNPIARIQRSEDFQPDTETVGVRLTDIGSGNDLETELRFVVFDRFELWYYFRRHFGDQSLSEYHLRFFFQTPRLRAQVGQDRAGLKGYFTLFNDLGDQTALVFQTDYALREKLWIVVRARYSYERRESIDGLQRYLVQRRFEPLAGLRIRY